YFSIIAIGKGVVSMQQTGTERVKRGMAEIQKGGVIMDVVNAEQAKVAEAAGAVAVMALERVPSDIRAAGGRCKGVRSAHCRRSGGCGIHSGNGEVQNRPYHRSKGTGITGCGLYR